MTRFELHPSESAAPRGIDEGDHGMLSDMPACKF